MKIEVQQKTSWLDALNAARFTNRQAPVTIEPSDTFKHNLLLSEHSPLRMLMFDIFIYDIPYYVHVHLVRHHVGVQYFVSTQRDDRTDNLVPRAQLPQDTPVNLQISLNAQALINISHLRLCSTAATETRIIWREVCNKVIEIAPEFKPFLVPSCIYRNGCPEFNSCGLRPKHPMAL